MAESAPLPVLLYLSALLDRTAHDLRGRALGTVRDLTVAGEGHRHDHVTGIVLAQRGVSCAVPWQQVAAVLGRDMLLSSAASACAATLPDEQLLLRRDVLDKQLIDVEGRRVVRANDVQLALADRELSVVGVFVSGRAVLRRLTGRYGPPAAGERLIPWQDVEVLADHGLRLRLRIPRERLAELAPVELAHIIESLSPHQGLQLVSALDDDAAADTMEELSDRRQTAILSTLDEPRAAAILDRMGPDQVADALAELDHEKAERLLQRLERRDVAGVRSLLAYPRDTAGGLMTTDFVALPASLSVRAAIRRLRTAARRPDFLHYLYVTTDEAPHRLLGVVAAPALLLAPSRATLRAVMASATPTVAATASLTEVARILADYNLLAVPVVADDGSMQGLVTVDDVLAALVQRPDERHALHLAG